ncbi:hypothetical protein N657DRAFT_82785 [Parathielavia appendiculata]|uniref:Uncharacterized protein n=1 Tax=Parathielavia appendiculata TaxID=2587402 RepID=A0AAN6UDE1_9PEZI|nr:hypothetical protein N657DRAFT_82785 [Parathielavia appendiculata]
MSNRPSPTRRSTQSSWEIVSESTHTKSRSPQLNGENMSSNQVANAFASDGSSVSLLTFSEFEVDIGAVATNDDRDPGYDPAHIPPSNGSTETAMTDGTLTNNHPVPTPCTAVPAAPAAPAYSQLTDANMDILQRELTQGWPANVHGWIQGAGMGDRLVRNVSFGSALTAASASRASGSTVATAGLDVLLPAAAADEVIAATGAWCFDVAGRGRKFSIVSAEDDGGY